MKGKIVTCKDIKGIWLVTEENDNELLNETFLTLELLLTDSWLKPKKPSTYACSHKMVNELSVPRILEKASYFQEAMNNIIRIIS